MNVFFINLLYSAVTTLARMGNETLLRLYKQDK